MLIRLLIKASLPLALLLGGFLLSGAPTAQAAGVLDTAHTICKGDTLQPAEVIMQQWTDWFQCQGGPWNPNNIQLVAPASTSASSQACSNSPVPPGFVVIQQALNNDACHSASMTIEPIALASSPLTICGSSPIPIGWLTVAESSLSIAPIIDDPCLLETGVVATKVLQLPPATSSITVCAASYIPPDFQIVSTTILDTSCDLDHGYSYSLQPSQGGPPLPDPSAA